MWNSCLCLASGVYGLAIHTMCRPVDKERILEETNNLLSL